MKKLLFILSTVLLINACGKSDEQNENKVAEEQIAAVPADISPSVGHFLTDFERFSEAQKYYFCAVFTIGAMSADMPITASAMRNYLLGIGAVRYTGGINDEVLQAWNYGKDIFRHEDMMNAVVEANVCEDVVEETARFAKENNHSVADLDKLGQSEYEKIQNFAQTANVAE